MAQTYWDLAGLIRAASVACTLLPRERVALLEEQAGLTLRSVARFLDGGADSGPLAATFNTERRQQQLRTAYETFEAIVCRWLVGDRRDGRFAWLIGPQFVVPGTHGDRSLRDVVLAEVQAAPTDGWPRRAVVDTLRRSEAADRWLPFVSVNGAPVVRGLGIRDRANLTASLARGCRSIGYPDGLRPWIPGFPSLVEALPVRWSYQFDPTDRCARAILRLEQAGYTNVGHLMVFHPEAVSFVAGLDQDALVKLQLILN